MTGAVSQFRAVMLALTAFMLWVVADTCLKFLGATPLPVGEVVALVGGGIAMWMLLLSAARGQVRGLWPRSPRRQFLRSLLDLGNNVFVVVALRHLPLTMFYVMVFLTPMVTTLAAAAFLRERLEWRSGLAILTGLAGVVIAVNPFEQRQASDWIGYSACLVCVACFSGNLVWSRVLTQIEAPEAMTFFSGLVTGGLGAVSMLRWAAPVSGPEALALGSAALCCVLGSLCFFMALRYTTPANVSQYHYSQLPAGAVVAWVLWRELPSVAMVAGAVLIVGAGVYTAARSYRGRLGRDGAAAANTKILASPE